MDLCDVCSVSSNQWWAICDAGWHMNNGHVACKELGYPSALELIVYSPHDYGNKPVLPIEFNCTGWEKSLKECSYRNRTGQLCNSNDVARVKCGKLLHSITGLRALVACLDRQCLLACVCTRMRIRACKCQCVLAYSMV